MSKRQDTNAVNQNVRDQVVRNLWTKGRACAADLANGMDESTNVDDVLKILQTLQEDGIVQEVAPDESDTRAYSRPYQTVYALVN